MLAGIKDLGYARPTPIQEAAIPPALAGKDVLATAQTGSGKTAAFLLPILHRLLARPRGATRALILTPTRELAQQIVDDLEDLATHTALSGAAVYGGVKPGPQEHAFRRGVDVIVATPGRLLDHARFAYGKLPHVEMLVLDEADRMLDMGFLPEIRKILKLLPVKRQTLFFSATMPPPIASLSSEMLRQPVTLSMGRPSTPAVGITQAVYPVVQDRKGPLLLALLERGDMQQALVFTRTKHRADRVARALQKAGVKAAQIHGNRSQAQRTQALQGFKNGRFDVLVATDIAARGIDVEALGHVVNFDVPRAPEDYIHRIGRTGRAEAVGEAFTFCAPDEQTEMVRIEKALGRRLPRVTVPDFDYSSSATHTEPVRGSTRPEGPRAASPRAATPRATAPARQAAPARATAHARPARAEASARQAAPARGSAPARSSAPTRGAAHPRAAAPARPAAPSARGPKAPKPSFTGEQAAPRSQPRPASGGSRSHSPRSTGGAPLPPQEFGRRRKARRPPRPGR